MTTVVTRQGIRARARLSSLVVRPDLVGASIAALLVFVLTRAIWTEPQWILSAWDASAVTARTDGIIHDVFARGHLDGWYDGLFVGHDATLFNGPGFAGLVGLISLVTFGGADTVESIALLTVLAFAGLPFAVAFTARRFGCSPQAAGLTAVFSLGVTFFAGVGIEGAFEVGLLAQHVAAPFAVASIGAVVALIREPTSGHARRAGLFVAATALIHPVSVTTLFLIFFVILFVELARGNTRPVSLVVTGARAIAVAVSMSAIWLIPSLVHRSLLGAPAAFGQPRFGTQVDNILSGDELLVGVLGPAVLVAAVLTALVPRWRGVAGPPLLVAVSYLVAAHVVRAAWPDDLTTHLTLRGVGYVGYLALIPLAVILIDLFGRIARPSIALTFTIVLAGTTVVASTESARSSIGHHPTPDEGMRGAALFLDDAVPDWGRFAVDQSWDARDRHGVGSIPHWLTAMSGASTLNGFNPEVAASSVSPILRELDVGRQLTTTETNRDTLLRMGVTHLVSLSPDDPSWQLGDEVYDSEWVRINTLDPDPQPFTLMFADGSPSDARARLTTYGVGRMDARIDATAQTDVVAAIGWSPRWRLLIDDEPAAVTRTGEGLIGFTIGPGTHTVELEHRLDRAHQLGLLVSLLTLIALAVGAMRRYAAGTRR